MSAVPVPLAATCCGLVEVLSLTCSVAGRAPSALGVNAIPSVHEVTGATVTGIAPQVPVPLRTYSESDGVALEMTSAAWPLLVTVRNLVTVSPTGSFPSANDAGTPASGVGVALGVGVAVRLAVAVAVRLAVAVAVRVAVVAVAVAVFVAV